MEWLYPLCAAFGAVLASLSGILFAAAVLRSWFERNLPLLATFSGGVFAVVVYHLLEEVLHESNSLALAAGGVLFGAALIQALHHLLPTAHHHHTLQHGHTHSPIDGKSVLISDGFHNIGDGVLLVAAFAAGPVAGVVATIGVVIHEMVQEIAEFFILRESGYSTRDALVFNVASASTIFIGVGVALFLSSSHEISVLFAGIAAGGFLAVLLQDLLPHALSSARAGHATYHVGAATAGIVLMLAVQSIMPHEEDHSASTVNRATETALPRLNSANTV